MKIQGATFGVYPEYWKLWFGNERPHFLSGDDVIEVSKRTKNELSFLLKQLYVVRYDILDTDTSVGLSEGYTGYNHKLNEYIQKYCSQVFCKPTPEQPLGNVHYFRHDQVKGKDNMVFRVQPRPMRGYRKAFVNRIQRWINAANHWTNDGRLDGYPAKILLIHQPRRPDMKDGVEKNQPSDYVLIQVPREYAKIMIDDGYFPAEYDDYTSTYIPDWEKKWLPNVSKEAYAEIWRQINDGLVRWRAARKIEREQEEAFEKAKKEFHRDAQRRRKTGPVAPRDLKYNKDVVTTIM